MLTAIVLSGSSLCIIGNLNRDLKPAALPAGDYLFADGETSVASVSETVGGGGANSAFAAAALGARVAFLGKVGADALGDRLERTLVRHGITARLARDPTQPTGTSIALTFTNGHRHFVSSLPNSESLAFDELDLAVLPQFRHLLRADIWFSEPMLYGGNQRLFHAARAAGLAVSIDLNWDPRWGRAGAAEIARRKEAVRAVLPLVTLAHGNVRELTEFTDAADLDTALRRLTGWGVEAVVVHLGERGAGYFCRGSLVVEPPATAKTRVNTTGTGDVLSVCMMLLHSQPAVPIPERLRLANQIVAEFIEGKRGLIPGIEA
ncbi:MAG: carbohydrate kinase family protein [Verrucomicrobia bacterium]|nr:carbohydrate kinase family protein [Verrucomicrobiota bacterium]